tara:strand:+ start:8720 stop:8935 length:216 start_codon:yes stop_codon:yes gene_type:complete
MGVQKNIGLLKSKNEQVTENLKLLILEEKRTRELVIGCLEILKLMPDYDNALKQLENNNLNKVTDNGHKGD